MSTTVEMVLACEYAGSGYGIRTRVSALRGQYPRPLDESASLPNVALLYQQPTELSNLGADNATRCPFPRAMEIVIHPALRYNSRR